MKTSGRVSALRVFTSQAEIIVFPTNYSFHLFSPSSSLSFLPSFLLLFSCSNCPNQEGRHSRYRVKSQRYEAKWSNVGCSGKVSCLPCQNPLIIILCVRARGKREAADISGVLCVEQANAAKLCRVSGCEVKTLQETEARTADVVWHKENHVLCVGR